MVGLNMTPEELCRIREGMDWTQTQAAAKAGVTANTWARWERGEVKPHALRARDLYRLLRHADKRAEKRAALAQRLHSGAALLAQVTPPAERNGTH